MSQFKAVGELNTQTKLVDYLSQLTWDDVCFLEANVVDTLLEKCYVLLSKHLSNIGKRHLLASLNMTKHYLLQSKRELLFEIKKACVIKITGKANDYPAIKRSFIKRWVILEALRTYASSKNSDAVARTAANISDEFAKALSGIQLQLVDHYHSGDKSFKTEFKKTFELDDSETVILDIKLGD